MPNDQTSTFPSYWPSSMARITSGAIQNGVPTKEFAGLLIDADPKSAVNQSRDKFTTLEPHYNEVLDSLTLVII